MNAKQKAQLHKITSRTLSKSATVTSTNNSLATLKNVMVEVTVGFGQAQMPLKKVLSLAVGDRIALDKKIGDSLDIYVNQTKVAVGELTLTDDGYGVIITRLIQDES